MSFVGHADEMDLVERIDELQVRIEHLESILFDQPEALAAEALAADVPAAEASKIEVAEVATAAQVTPASPVTPVTEAPGAEAPEAHEARDLRRLQAEATAGIGVIHSEAEPAGSIFDLSVVEERVAGRALALVGGTALLLGAIFFLSLAFSRGWIGPDVQVMLGLAGGTVGLLVGAVLLVRGDRLVGHVLAAVGLAVISLSFFAATSLYELVDPALALGGVFAAATLTTVIAVLTGSQIVAGFGLVAVMGAPPVLGAQPEPITIAYMAAALAGVAAVSLWQTWPWLPPVAFLLSLPQLYQWIATEPAPLLAVSMLLLYWTLMTVAAGGEAFRSPRRELSVTSAPLFLAVGACVVGLGFMVVQPDEQRAALLLVLAAMHGTVTAFFARRRGMLDPFGLLSGAYGVALASAAVPLLFGATVTSVVWAAEAATLAFFAGRRAHGPSLIGAAVLYGIAAGQVAIEALRQTGIVELSDRWAAASPVEAIVAGFLFLVAIGAVIVAFVPARSLRLLVVGTAGLVAIPVASMTLDGVALVGACVAVGVLTIGAPRWLATLPERHVHWRLGPALEWLRPTNATEPAASLLPIAAGLGAMFVATVSTVLTFHAQGHLPGIPFTDEAGLCALVLAVGYVAVGLVSNEAASMRLAVLAAGLTMGLASFMEVPAPWFVLVWAALAAGAAWLARLDDDGTVKYQHMALGALTVLGVLAVTEAPPGRLLVDRFGVEPHPLLVSEATLALGALAVALGLAAHARTIGPRRLGLGLWALAGVVVLYLLSVGIVDVFSGEAYWLGRAQMQRVDELAKEAQVALSVLWTVAGVAVLGTGLVLRWSELRIAGLVVLGLATIKVFLVDLSSLDVAYRVITLIVLGLLLVASAFAWSRMRPGGTPGAVGSTSGAEGGRPVPPEALRTRSRS